VPIHQDRRLFELLILEGAQAGLSWSTILRKRAAYRKAFDGFDAKKIARYSAVRVRRLMKDAGIVRNVAKIEGHDRQCAAFLAVQREHGRFDTYPGSSSAGAHAERLAPAVAVSNRDRGLAGHEPRSPRAGLPIRWADICYAFISGHRHGERPPA